MKTTIQQCDTQVSTGIGMKTTHKLSELLSTDALTRVTAKYASLDEHYFLTETLKDRARVYIEEAIEGNHLPQFDVDTVVDSINYSLGCSQGDGVCFKEGKTDYIWVNDSVSVRYYIRDLGGRYSHENTFEVEFDVDGEDDSFEQSFILECERYTENLREICRKLEKFGYEAMEFDDRNFAHECVLKKFLEENNIEDCDIFDYSFGDKDEKNIVEVGDMMSTNVSTYVEDFELVRHERKTLNDGEVVKVEYYYTPEK